ncbi:MAG: porin [Planctomycetaceae bacterium]
MASAPFRSVWRLVVLLLSLPLFASDTPADGLPPSTDAALVTLQLAEPAQEALAGNAPPPAPPVDFQPQSDLSGDDRYGILLRRIEELEAAEANRAETEQKKADDDKKKKADDELKLKGWIDVSEDKWNVKMGGDVQGDYINWADHSRSIPNTHDYFEFRRLRLTADGTGYGVYDFRLQMTLEPETVGTGANSYTTPQVKDAYFSINEVPWLGRVRVGNFFVPFGLEQVTNDRFSVFLERSIPAIAGVFTADREIGLATYNCTDDQSLSWATGVFFDSITEGLRLRIDNNQGYRVSGRVNWVPYYDEPSNGRFVIHTGAGILYTYDQNDQVQFAARPQIHQGPQIINSGVLNANSYTNANVEFAAVMGPFTVQSEAYVSSVDMRQGDPQTFYGWYAHASYFLTGENRAYERFGQHGAQFGRTLPHNNVFGTPAGCSWGAWELKIRHSYLNLNAVSQGVYSDITAGFNWYWSDRTRLMFDYIHPNTTNGAVFGATSSDILATRFDFNW